MLGREHSRHLFHILRRLVLHDVHGVVEGDDTDKTVFRVDHRQCQKVVLREHLCDLLLIVQRAHGNDVVGHDGLDRCIVIFTQKKVLDRHQTDELVPLGDVAGVDRLFVDARAADAENCFADRHVRAQGNVLGRHDRACGILGVTQDFVDLLAHLGVRLREDSLDDVCRHFLDDIHRVVDVKLVDDLFQLAV